MLSLRKATHMERFTWFITKSKSDPKPYQYSGVQWLVRNETRPDPPMNRRGGFLADEMGLGKTIMMIGVFISNLLPRTLIVLPTVLLPQWESEIYRTTGHRVVVYHGAAKKNIDLEQLNRALIVLTTYNTIAVGEKKEPCLLHQVSWNRIVFDEAHHLRNKNSRWFGARLLKASIRWLISGTPIQNKRRDFYNLCSALLLPASYYANKENLQDVVKNFVLRRTKKEVGISIPDIKQMTRTVKWGNVSERKLSEDIHSALRVSPAKLLLLMRARQSCIYPAMLTKKIVPMVKNSVLPPNNDYLKAVTSSSKMDSVVRVLLERKSNGNGKLVFCHFREEIDVLIKRLQDAGFNNVAFFDGRVGQAKRIRTLAGHFEVLVLQIQTGCEGLNLQKDFSEVYFISPDWNPAVEEQAVARCHRIGQTKEVQVFRFEMTRFSPEEKKESEDSEEEKETIDAVSSETLDQYISKTQDSKREIREKILSQ